MSEGAKQRLDRWLWFARMLKSRTLAQKLVQSGAVRIDGNRITGADHRVSAGMVLTMTLHQRLRILKILNTGTRRGPASEAVMLYEDLTPELPPRNQPQIARAIPIDRPQGTGRPTKKQRRETDRLISSGPDEDDL